MQVCTEAHVHAPQQAAEGAVIIRRGDVSVAEDHQGGNNQEGLLRAGATF